MKKLLLTFGFLSTFSIFLASSGCLSPAIVSPIIQGVIIWHEGEAHKYYDYNQHTIYRASKRALTELDIPITDESFDESGYGIIAGENNRFKIKIEEVESNISRLSVRINFMGDKPLTELFYDKVDKETPIIVYDSNGMPVKQEHKDN